MSTRSQSGPAGAKQPVRSKGPTSHVINFVSLSSAAPLRAGKFDSLAVTLVFAFSRPGVIRVVCLTQAAPLNWGCVLRRALEVSIGGLFYTLRWICLRLEVKLIRLRRRH